MKNYYTGGLAEIVSNPSEITLSYFKKWFTGSSSLGLAMKNLNLPYNLVNEPLLVFKDNSLVVDLTVEEKTFYQNTIFFYQPQEDVNNLPNLKIKSSKLLNPKSLINTGKIILSQANWIASPEKLLSKLGQNLNQFPQQISESELEDVLIKQIWPAIIEIATVTEFFNQLLQKESPNQITQLQDYIFAKVSENDWFLQSTKDQFKVKNNQMTLDEYLKIYGLRADDDYELTSPRWYEIPDKIQSRINKSEEVKLANKIPPTNLSNKQKKLVESNINLQLLRLEAKKKALFFIDKLRQKLIKEGQIKINNDKRNIKSLTSNPLNSNQKSGRGLPVSSGQVTGSVLNIKSPDDDIPKNTIAIFPNASPAFANLYPKCIGMIFKKGGQTSHGAIVAREFKIPALIDVQALISDGTKLTLNGQTGYWHIEAQSN